MLFLKSLLIILILYNGSSHADEDGYVSSRGSFADERWREKHQWKGRNAGGWRHGYWYGGIDENEPEREGEAYIWYYDMNALPPERPEQMPVEESVPNEDNKEETPEGHGVYIESKRL